MHKGPLTQQRIEKISSAINRHQDRRTGGRTDGRKNRQMGRLVTRQLGW